MTQQIVEPINILRSYQVFKPDECPPVDIIGAGATGSRVFEILVSLGLTNITVYDDDKVESHNLGNQLFIRSDLGKTKVSGLRRFVKRKLGYVPDTMNFIPYKYKSPPRPSSHQYKKVPYIYPERLADQIATQKDLPRVCFLLVDSMLARRQIMRYIRTMGLGYGLVVETRMGAQHGYCYAINPSNIHQINRWHDTLFEDSQAADQGACQVQITVASTAQLLSSLAVNELINYVNGIQPSFYQGIYTNPSYYEREA